MERQRFIFRWECRCKAISHLPPRTPTAAHAALWEVRERVSVCWDMKQDFKVSARVQIQAFLLCSHNFASIIRSMTNPEKSSWYEPVGILILSVCKHNSNQRNIQTGASVVMWWDALPRFLNTVYVTKGAACNIKIDIYLICITMSSDVHKDLT